MIFVVETQSIMNEFKKYLCIYYKKRGHKQVRVDIIFCSRH